MAATVAFRLPTSARSACHASNDDSPSPVAIRRPIAANLARATVHVNDARSPRILRPLQNPRIIPPSHRVRGHLLEIAARNQFLKRLRPLMLVKSVFLDHKSQGKKVLLQRIFAGIPDGCALAATR